MNINLTQNDIKAAIVAHLESQGLYLKNKTVTMDFTAGRKQGNGLSVDVAIENNDNSGLAPAKIYRNRSADISNIATTGIGSGETNIRTEEYTVPHTTDDTGLDSPPWETLVAETPDPTVAIFPDG